MSALRAAWEIYRDAYITGEADLTKIMPELEKVFWAGAQAAYLAMQIQGFDETVSELAKDEAMRVRALHRQKDN